MMGLFLQVRIELLTLGLRVFEQNFHRHQESDELYRQDLHALSLYQVNELSG